MPESAAAQCKVEAVIGYKAIHFALQKSEARNINLMLRLIREDRLAGDRQILRVTWKRAFIGMQPEVVEDIARDFWPVPKLGSSAWLISPHRPLSPIIFVRATISFATPVHLYHTTFSRNYRVWS